MHAQSNVEFASALAGIKIDEIQVLGTHNSYARPVDRRVTAMVEPRLEELMSGLAGRMTPQPFEQLKEEHSNGLTFGEGLTYNHPDLKTQLDAGMRSLEIDVNPDPEGGRFLNPSSYRILREKGVIDLEPHDTAGLDQPGFKVLHVPDIDFRSHCNTFKLCLSKIRDWSDAHTGHVRLFILIEAKSQAIPILPGATQLAPFDAAAFDALDAGIVPALGRERLITPDDVRGRSATLNEAALAKNWPTLKDARGKALFLMITAVGPAETAGYLAGHPSLKGRVGGADRFLPSRQFIRHFVRRPLARWRGGSLQSSSGRGVPVAGGAPGQAAMRE